MHSGPTSIVEVSKKFDSEQCSPIDGYLEIKKKSQIPIRMSGMNEEEKRIKIRGNRPSMRKWIVIYCIVNLPLEKLRGRSFVENV